MEGRTWVKVYLCQEWFLWMRGWLLEVLGSQAVFSWWSFLEPLLGATSWESKQVFVDNISFWRSNRTEWTILLREESNRPGSSAFSLIKEINLQKIVRELGWLGNGGGEMSSSPCAHLKYETSNTREPRNAKVMWHFFHNTLLLT